MQVSSPAETTAMQPDQGMLPLGLNSSTFRGENGEESLVISCEREARDGDGGWSRKHSAGDKREIPTCSATSG